jgi:DNA gyrase subunit A
MPEPKIHVPLPLGRVIETDIVPEMEKSYLDYAMSVIVSRALPDVRDGLKPVHRRIIYAMHKLNLTPGGKYVKCAAIVGDVMKTYHPHGDMAIYMTLVRLAQSFSMRYMLVTGQGNFGSIDGDPPAAMRYTEARMSKMTPELITDIDKDTVDTMDNYDGTTQEPTVLPSRVPNLLLNGAEGIAVGMATRIPPHNLVELCTGLDLMLEKAKLEIVDQPPPNFPPSVTTLEKIFEPIRVLSYVRFNFETEATIDDLLTVITGPDFPTAGEIYGKKGIVEMYNTGKGKFTLRGKAAIEETKSGKIRIIITQLPYQVNKAELVKKIADLVRDKKISGISDLRDESDRHGIRVVVELKKISKPKSILNKLYKFTSLQTSYSANLLALVGGVPQTLNLRQILLVYLRHREAIVRRRTIYELKINYQRAHILEGLKIALDNLDEVIKTIRASETSETAKTNLMVKFNFTDLQADAILEMQLRRLAALERQKIENEYNEVNQTIKDLTAIIKEPDRMINVIKGENKEVMDKFNDPRLTKIYVRELEDFSEEDLIPKEPTVVLFTKSGYIKRVTKDTYRSQHRGGVGVVGMATKSEDEVDCIMSVTTHDKLLFFTNRGRVFTTRVWDVPESSRQSRGVAAVNLVNTVQSEQIQAILSLPAGKLVGNQYILLATKNGVVKKTLLSRFEKIRQNGLTAINLDVGDQLVWAETTTGDDQVFIVSHQGKCIRFHESDIRPMGRHTRGVRGITLKKGDYLVSLDVLPSVRTPSTKKQPHFFHLLTVTEKGIGKRSDVFLYPLQKRGGMGVKVSQLSDKTGNVATAKVVTENHLQAILISRKAVTINLPLSNIPVLNRSTQGVILMRLKDATDQVSTMTVIEKEIEEPIK